MARTVNRQPFSVPIRQTKDGFFNHVNFKGLCDNKNDILIDTETFADINNMYVDDNNILTSRPPLKFFDDEAFIVDQWTFGDIGLRLYRTENENDFLFTLRCITNEIIKENLGPNTYSEMQWSIPISEIGYDFVPKIKHIQIEDKIFIWFAGIDFVCFNTSGIYFENATKYIYFPVHELVVNGIESDLETKNFLTETYKKRHHYSAVSSVNFEKLTGKQMNVSLNSVETQDKSKHLYDITVQKNQNKILVYPYSPIGNNYHIDIAQTSRATVVMRYSSTLNTIEVSFDGKNFRPLPTLENIIGNPQLTKDGMWVVAFTTEGLGKCRIVAQETADFMNMERVFSWVVDNYMRNSIADGYPNYSLGLDTSFIPTGYFETIDQFAYIFRDNSINFLYVEWLSGIKSDIMYGTHIFDNIDFDDNIKVFLKTVTPTLENRDPASVVSIIIGLPLLQTDTGHTDNLLYNVFFTQSPENIDRTLENNDLLDIVEIISPQDVYLPTTGYVHKLNIEAKDLITTDNKIRSGDTICFSNLPMNISKTDTYDGDIEYSVGDIVTWNSYVYHCKSKNIGISPTNGTSGTLYWTPFLFKNSNGVDEQFYSYDIVRYAETTIVPYTHYYATYSWKLSNLLYKPDVYTRYIIEKLDGSIGDEIKINDKIKITSINFAVTYTADELQAIFGDFPYDETDETKSTWAKLWPSYAIPPPSPAKIYAGNGIIRNTSNTVNVSRIRWLSLDVDGLNSYEFRNFGIPCNQMDLNIITEMNIEKALYNINIGYNFLGAKFGYEDKFFDCFGNYNYDYIADTFPAPPTGWTVGDPWPTVYSAPPEGWTQGDPRPTTGYPAAPTGWSQGNAWPIIYPSAESIGWTVNDPWPETVFAKRFSAQMIYTQKSLVEADSKWFKIMPNTKNILTDKYLWADGETIILPRNGELFSLAEDNEREISNNDNFLLSNEDGEMIYNGNIHRLTGTEGDLLSSAPILSGDTVSYINNIERDFLSPSEDGKSNKYKIEKIQNGVIVPVGDKIRINDLVVLTADDSYEYPEQPVGWEPNDPWPTTFPTYAPLLWNGDTLPIGPIKMCGKVNIRKNVIPVSIDSNGLWYNIDGTLWTSQLDTKNTIELDEYINSKDEGSTRTVDFRSDVPDYDTTLNEHFISFVTQENHNLLQVTSTRRDEDKLFTDNGNDLLIYLPKINEQQFSKKITNLHTLSEKDVGIFTQDEIWYVQTLLNDYGSVSALTKPTKSKIPIGCRDGSDIITALNGQFIIFTTQRGIAALSPQNFIASTEQTLTYLSDNIQNLYTNFYNDLIYNASSILYNDFKDNNYIFKGAKPIIKITTYKYWILFYRYMDKKILAFDSRSSTWWLWTTPYPIKSLTVGSRLQFLMQLDFSYLKNNEIILPSEPTLLGVNFLWTDNEFNDKFIPFTDIVDTNDISYYDDIVENVIDGRIERIPYQNTTRYQIYYPDNIIKWHFVSQRLHFKEINNYKLVKAINMVAKGITTQTAKLSTKVYRDFYHPEKSEVTEIKINDIRTFIKRMNLMHLINFQYKLETDIGNESQSQLKLNSLGVKYELKERIR